MVRVTLQRKSHGRWINVKTIATKLNGSFSIRLHVKARGLRSFRIRVAGTSANAAAVSRTLKIRVR